MLNLTYNYVNDDGILLDDIVEVGDVVVIVKQHPFPHAFAGIEMVVGDYDEKYAYLKPLNYHSSLSNRRLKQLGFHIENIRLIRKANNPSKNDYSKLTNFGLF